MIKRALINMVDNAIGALESQPQEAPRIRVALRQEGQAVRLEVEDNGPGVPEASRHHLFEPYFSTKQRGTGLGLSIAAKIIQEHGGTIRAEKNEPAGAKFIVELKVAGAGDSGQHSAAVEDANKVVVEG